MSLAAPLAGLAARLVEVVGAVSGITSGRWSLRPWLVGRPAGPLPDVVAGASPAYDIAAAPCWVGRVEISVDVRESRIRSAEHPEVVALLDVTAARHRAWHRPWQLAPGTRVLVVHEGGRVAVAAAVHRDPGSVAWSAGPFLAGEGATPEAGSILLDAVGGLALGDGGRIVVLDDSVLLDPHVLRPLRHGYVVAPAYDGDPDAPVWLERSLPSPDAT
ncbi:MAG: hypothetical protein R2737_10285 [Candidatus Nanopelagicales bacterium]